MLLGLRTTIHTVEDIAAATAWYTKLVGHAPYFDEPFYVGFNVGGFELGLIPDASADATTYWGTPDIAAEVERTIGIGATLVSPIKDVGSDIKVATLTDPFGNRFGLIQNPHFKLEG
jgi:predicted enzyme related to lactoylglutathione lyase